MMSYPRPVTGRSRIQRNTFEQSNTDDINVSGFSADTLPDSDYADDTGRAAHFARLKQ
jgi:hypothetical protein